LNEWEDYASPTPLLNRKNTLQRHDGTFKLSNLERTMSLHRKTPSGASDPESEAGILNININHNPTHDASPYETSQITQPKLHKQHASDITGLEARGSVKLAR